MSTRDTAILPAVAPPLTAVTLACFIFHGHEMIVAGQGSLTKNKQQRSAHLISLMFFCQGKTNYFFSTMNFSGAIINTVIQLYSMKKEIRLRRELFIGK